MSNTDHDWPYVDFRIDVEQVLKDDGTIASGRPLLYKMADSRTATGAIPQPDPGAGFPMARPGERYLLFLVPAPDKFTWGSANHAFGRLIIDDLVVKASDGQRTPLAFDGHEFTPAEFVRQVRTVIAQQRNP